MARAERSAAFGSSSLKPGDRRGPAGAGVSSFHRASLSAGPDGEGARFAELLDRCERLGTRTLPFDDLRELGRLYRLHAARLARLRDRGDDPEAIRHLNALCVRAYTTLYARPAREPSATPPLLQRLPEAIGRTWRAQVVAWVLLLTGLLVGGALATRTPEALHALLPDGMGYSAGMLDRLVASAAERARFLAGDPTPVAHNLLFGSALFVHNTRIGLLAFATGMLAAVPTVLLQLYNGILLGAFASVFLRDPWPVAFLAWILPHAIPELTAISLCAAGGLVLGGAVAAPGRHGRRAAVRTAANSALLLLAAAIPLFALAAFIESFVRQSALPAAVRLAVAAVMAAMLGTALWYVRRAGRRVPVDASWVREVGGRPFTAPARTESPGSGSGPPT